MYVKRYRCRSLRSGPDEGLAAKWSEGLPAAGKRRKLSISGTDIRDFIYVPE